MPQSTTGLFHHQKRKRVHQKLEPFFHTNKVNQFFDRLIYVMGFIVPLLTIPQATNIWLNKTADGVSMITWSVYLVNTIIWTIYGVLHKEKPIIFTFTFMTIVNIFVVAGIIVY